MINMESLLYSEINIVCILILAILLFKIVTSVDKRLRDYLFARTILLSILFILVDLIWGMINTGVLNVPISGYYVLNVVYYTLASLNCSTWLVYTLTGLYPKLENNRRERMLMYLPSVAVLILMTVSCFTHITFYVGNDLQYYKGPLYFLQIVLSYCPLVLSFACAIYSAFMKKNYANRRRFVTLGLFPIFPIFFGLAQIVFLDLALLSVGVMLGILLVYINRTDLRISIDALTQINNRNQLLKNLNREMNDESNRDSLYLFIMDADYFKDINDTYGHAEGDNALVRIADILREVAANCKGNCSIYRYGGDEFIMLAHADTDEQAMDIKSDINEVVKRNNEITDSPYNLAMSVGYAKYEVEYDSIPDFIKAADKHLYRIKKARTR